MRDIFDVKIFGLSRDNEGENSIMTKITVDDLQEWGSQPRDVNYINKTYQGAISLHDVLTIEHRVLPETGDIVHSEWLGRVLCDAIIHLPDERYDSRIATRLLEVGRSENIYRAAMEAPDSRYSDSFLSWLIMNGTSRWLSQAVVNLPGDRFDTRLIDRLLDAESNGMDVLFAAINLPSVRYTPRLLGWLLMYGEGDVLARAVIELPDTRYRRELLVMLYEKGSGDNLQEVAVNAPDDRFEMLMIEKLLQRGEGLDLCSAACGLPDDRFDQRVIDQLIKVGCLRSLLIAAARLPEDRYHSSILRAAVSNSTTSELEQLGHIIAKIPRNRLIPPLDRYVG